MPNLLAICLFCGCFIVIVCLSLWCWELDVEQILLVPEFSLFTLIVVNNLERSFVVHKLKFAMKTAFYMAY